MIPSTTIIALIITLVVILKPYFNYTNRYNNVLYLLTIISWFIVFFGNNTMSFIIYGILGIISLAFFTGLIFYKQDENNENSQELISNTGKTEYYDMHTGKIGTIRHIYGEGKYLGTIVLNGQINEIIVHCNEDLHVDDKFEVLGLKKDGKIYCKKVLSE